ncbi:MAG: hypothetical protein ABWY97_02155 [Thermoleophilaceae bacterium]
MTRTFRTSRLAVAVGVAALAGAALAPAATAIPYEDLRSPDAVDAARAAGEPPRVVPRAAPIAALGGDGAQDLRSPDTRDVATGYGPTTASQPAVDTSPASDGFDWTSAAIGAAAGAGLLLILIAAFAGTGRPGRRSIPARGQSAASA